MYSTTLLRQPRWLALLIVSLLVLCQTTSVFAASNLQAGGSDTSDQDSAAIKSAEDAPAMADPDGAVQSVEDVRTAVVQIEAVGTFVDPTEGTMIAGGSGSGFIIDPEGIAVTNNHVVTGGALFKVYIDGEEEPRNARVLGVSECADLAVIDIQGDGFPYVTWYTDKAKVGLEVFAAGFPLGDPEFTMTKGIIAKEKADGESDWASVDHVLQHDASINPGNSGGPLVDENGYVVGVNYAGNNDNNQYFAIATDQALPVIEKLMTGLDVDSIGINGQARVFEDDLTGIFVSSVASGSLADDAGIEPGDILISLEGIPMGLEGLMTEYCDILRSHDMSEDTLAVEVFRPDTGEVLDGQINGRPLELSFSVAEEVEGSSGTATTGEEVAGYENYVTISDENETFSLEVPEEWSDVSETTWDRDDKEVGIRLFASPNLKDFSDSWGIPGVIFGYSEELAGEMSSEDLVNSYDFSKDCKEEGDPEELPEGFFAGHFKSWKECGEDGVGSALLVGLTPLEDDNYVVLLEIYAASDADIDATDRILDTFVVYSDAGTSGNTGGPSASEEEILAQVDVSGLEYEYGLVEDDAVSALMPNDWDDQVSDEWTNEDGDETYGARFTASTSVDDYNSSWDTAGLQVRSATDLEEALDIDEWLDADVEALKDDCKKDKKRYDIEHEIAGQSWEGSYDLYTRCGKKSNTYYVLAANSVPAGSFVYALFLATEDADKEAFEVFTQSFFVGSSANANEGGNLAINLVEVTDETGQMTISVPESWADVSSERWTTGDDEYLGPSMYVAEDVDGFNDGYETPGLFLAVGPELLKNQDVETVLDNFKDLFKDDCKYDDRYEYADENLEGQIDVWLQCGDVEGNTLSVLAAAPIENPTTLVIVYANAPTSDDVIDFGEVLAPLDVSEITLDGGNGTTSLGSAEEPVTTEEELVTVEVVAAQLNVREGPGTNYARVTTVSQGDELGVAGQAQNCEWLYVVTPDVEIGWVAGGAQYVKFTIGSCEGLPDASILAPEAPSGNSGGSTGGSSGGSTGGQTGNAQGSSPAANKGCIQFQNHIGDEATVTITNKGNGKAETFKVAKNVDLDKCFDPGKYALTVDVPPPWNSINLDIELAAGDYFSFPIEGE